MILDKDNNLLLDNIILGNCLDILKQIPDESIDCIVTSPPYWGLRDYGTAQWKEGDIDCNHINYSVIGGQNECSKKQHSNKGTQLIQYINVCKRCGAKRIDFQLGIENTFQEYINNLCIIFDEIKRILKRSGTLWVNLGDTYSSTSAGNPTKSGLFEKTNNPSQNHQERKDTSKTGVTQKSLCQIPSRFAIEMCERGWILRNEIIWEKPNAMPSSIKDRFTVNYEKIFFFTKNKKYYFNQQLEPLAESSIKSKNYKLNQTTHKGASKSAVNVQLGNMPRGNRFVPEKGKNKRCIWKIPTKPFKDAHFATYPIELIRTCISAGCPEKGIILDPFFGSGTTAIEAINQNKHYIGIELNPEYIEIANKRIAEYLLQQNNNQLKLEFNESEISSNIC